ncbi:cupin domain-containing protein [Planococcus sp. N028]|uniref:Cupin domain-containing protein n=1 Tax=Planococcus shixiaomingii TaxID=3058393 RepID=A0ABT8N4L6_9BACL|nr:cupin domain-containing protein [Planococcus sp. N028]MDN7242833.1 cupin domain-containing protein [Planococcus sp. N028]
MVHQMSNAFSFAHGEGDAYWFNGTLMEVKATGNETNGAFSLLEGLLPSGYETPLYAKTNEEDMFYVLEGEITFTVGEKTIKGIPGTFVYVPRHIKHKFKVEGSTPAKALFMFTPAGVEQFFIEMSVPADKYELPSEPMELDMEKFAAAGQKYGIENLG